MKEKDIFWDVDGALEEEKDRIELIVKDIEKRVRDFLIIIRY